MGRGKLKTRVSACRMALPMLYQSVLGHYSASTSQEGATMKASSVILTIAVLAAATTTSADAQGRGRGKDKEGVPPGQRPPAGMCRIWIDGVPPGHQPAPTDCETAVRNQPRNSQIIWGDNTDRNRVVSNANSRYDRYGRRNGRNRDASNGGYSRDSHGHLYDPSCIDEHRDGWCDYHTDIRSGVHPGGTPGNNGGNNGCLLYTSDAAD